MTKTQAITLPAGIRVALRVEPGEALTGLIVGHRVDGVVITWDNGTEGFIDYRDVGCLVCPGLGGTKTGR